MATIPEYVISSFETGTRWNTGVLTFSIPTTGSTWAYEDEPSSPSYSTFDSVQANQFRAAISAWDKVIELDFMEVTEPETIGDLRIGFTSIAEFPESLAAGWASYPGYDFEVSGDIWLQSSYSSSKLPEGSFDYTILLHELGHALGLDHPDDLPDSENNFLYSQMSQSVERQVKEYTLDFYINSEDSITYEILTTYSSAPMLYDIAIAQHLYGAESNTNIGNTTYTWESNEKFYTSIWDSSGSDTIDASNQEKPSIINLESGTFSSINVTNLESLINATVSEYPDYWTDWITEQYDTLQKDIYTGENNLSIAYGAIIENAIGGINDDTIIGNEVNNEISGGKGDDTLTGGEGNDMLTGGEGNDTLNGGSDIDTAVYGDNLSKFNVTGNSSSARVENNFGSEGRDSLSNIERLQFTDYIVNLTVAETVTSITSGTLQQLQELYVAFFNRMPDADGIEYWIGQYNAGKSINQIAESFYNVGVQYGELTGFTSSMTDTDFINVVYGNVLGREDGPDSEGLAHWISALQSGAESNATLVSSIIAAAHTYKGDSEFGWVADLLDHKVEVAHLFSVEYGLNNLTPEESISKGMAIAAAITPTNTDAAIELIGVIA